MSINYTPPIEQTYSLSRNRITIHSTVTDTGELVTGQYNYTLVDSIITIDDLVFSTIPKAINYCKQLERNLINNGDNS